MSLNKFTIQKSFAINAGAGSGKTYTLSRRYINAILGFDFFRESNDDELFYDNLKKAKVEEIVTITYTEATALEMKERIFSLINKILHIDTLEERDNDKNSISDALEALTSTQKEYVNTTLEKAIKQSSNAKISTIHSFCLDILKTNADITKFDSSVDIIKDDEKEKLISQCIFETINKSENKETISEISNYLNLFFLNTIFRKYAFSSTFREQFNSFDKNSLDKRALKFLLLDLYKLPDVKDDYEIVCNKFDEVGLEAKYKEFVSEYIKNYFNFNAKTWNELSKEFDVTIQFNKRPFTQMKDIKENIENIKLFENFYSIYQAIDEKKEELFYRKIELLKSIMQDIKSLYDTKLKELGNLDFDEIIEKTFSVIKAVKTNIKYMMVDEFQDTNSLQYEIIKNSLNANSNLFVVGDSKQSIYAFQGAEIEVFNEAISDTNYISQIVPMDVNFRSDGVVLSSVNKIFSKILTKNEDITTIKQNYEAQAQDLKVSHTNKETQGSFSFLIKNNQTSSENDEEAEDSDEFEQIAKFIANIKHNKLVQYSHISDLLANNKKAIAVVFDSKTKMLRLKEHLNNYNIKCKVSASENFYHSKEINDIFNLLMSLQQPNNSFYKAAALRSSFLKYSDNEIYKIISNNEEAKELQELKKEFDSMTLSQFILYVYQKYSIKDVQNYLIDSEQRRANLDKFLFKVLEDEAINGNNNYQFLKQLEHNIYFSEAQEDEAFFKSDDLESIQICTIHSTKGLAYPMVILANSDKNIYSQIQSDSIKSNSFTLINGQNKLVAGFKVDNYEPLSFRLLKTIDKLKHLAEKKRLLYVALTRAEHDIVISANLKKPNVSSSSYLGMIVDGLELDIEALYNQELENSITNLEDIEIYEDIVELKNSETILKELKFEEIGHFTSATEKSVQDNNEYTRLGTITHKIIELYWDKLEDIELQDIFDKFDIEIDSEKSKIETSINKFKNSEIYKLLKSSIEHRFELEFNYQGKKGFIDLIYFDKSKNAWVIIDFKTGNKTAEKENEYKKQLEFYEDVLKDIGLNVSQSKIEWV